MLFSVKACPSQLKSLSLSCKATDMLAIPPMLPISNHREQTLLPWGGL